MDFIPQIESRVLVLLLMALICCGCQPAESVRTEPTDNNDLAKETNADDIKLWLNRLEDEDHISADEAYMKLFVKGKDAIPYLIANADNTKPFHGYAHVNPLSSLIIEPPAVGVISLYIVECMLNPYALECMLNPDVSDLYPYPQFHPHLVAMICNSRKPGDGGGKADPEAQVLAKKAYEIWWERNRSRSLKEIIEIDGNPLKGTSLHWR